MAEAITAPAEAQRQRDRTRKTERLVRWYRALAQVPEYERENVLAAANRFAVRRWYLYAPVVALIVWILQRAFLPGIFGELQSMRAPYWQVTLAIGTTAFIKRYTVHKYIRRAAKALQSGAVDHADRPRA